MDLVGQQLLRVYRNKKYLSILFALNLYLLVLSFDLQRTTLIEIAVYLAR